MSMDASGPEPEPLNNLYHRVCVRDVSWHTQVLPQHLHPGNFATKASIGTGYHECWVGEPPRRKHGGKTRMERFVEDVG